MNVKQRPYHRDFEYLTISQVAEKVGVTKNIVIKWLREDGLPAAHFSKRLVRIKSTDVDDFVRRHSQVRGAQPEAKAV